MCFIEGFQLRDRISTPFEALGIVVVAKCLDYYSHNDDLNFNDGEYNIVRRVR